MCLEVADRNFGVARMQRQLLAFVRHSEVSVLDQDRDRLAGVRPADAKSLPSHHDDTVARHSTLNLFRPSRRSRWQWRGHNACATDMHSVIVRDRRRQALDQLIVTDDVDEVAVQA